MKVIKIKAHIKEQEAKKVSISTPFIKLDAFLKLCDAVQTGGHAKMVIQDGEVRVNGEVCLMRGKKLHPGDVVSFAGQRFEVAEQA